MNLIFPTFSTDYSNNFVMEAYSHCLLLYVFNNEKHLKFPDNNAAAYN